MNAKLILLAGAMLLASTAIYCVTNRYQLIDPPTGLAFKLDRWTGKTWRVMSGGSSGRTGMWWEEIGEPSSGGQLVFDDEIVSKP